MPEYVGSGNRKRVRVNEASAADAGTGADEDVTQQSQTQDAMAKDLRHPQRAPNVPVGERKILGREALSRLENGNSIALLGQAKGGDRAAKPRADDQYVVSGDQLHGRHAPPTAQPCQSAVTVRGSMICRKFRCDVNFATDQAISLLVERRIHCGEL